jgi:hypothetical protein
MDRLGREVGRAIKGHQKLIPKDSETVEQVVLFQALKDRENDGIEMARGNRIEEGADLVVTGNLLDAEQGLGVIASLAGGPIGKKGATYAAFFRGVTNAWGVSPGIAAGG